MRELAGGVHITREIEERGVANPDHTFSLRGKEERSLGSYLAVLELHTLGVHMVHEMWDRGHVPRSNKSFAAQLTASLSRKLVFIL